MDILTYPAFEYDDDGSWSALSYWLESHVRNWVYTSDLPCWKGEEEAMVEEIVDETVMHILERINKVSTHGAKPIVYLYSFARRTAFHCFIDLVRKDHRKIRLSQIADGSEKSVIEDNLPSMEETVHERLSREQLFDILAREIIHFPKKQKEAILRDQAKLIDIMPDPMPLLRAYQNVGIQLQDYGNYSLMSCAEKRRHSSLLHYAYQRLSRSTALRQYYRQSA